MEYVINFSKKLRNGRLPDSTYYIFNSQRFRYILHLRIFDQDKRLCDCSDCQNKQRMDLEFMTYFESVWCFNGKPHRLDGPAIIHMNNGFIHASDGSEYLPRHRLTNGKYWYYYGAALPVQNIEEFQEAVKLLIIQRVLNS